MPFAVHECPLDEPDRRAVHFQHEVLEPGASAKFSIGDALQADVFLHFNDPGYALILKILEFTDGKTSLVFTVNISL